MMDIIAILVLQIGLGLIIYWILKGDVDKNQSNIDTLFNSFTRLNQRIDKAITNSMKEHGQHKQHVARVEEQLQSSKNSLESLQDEVFALKSTLEALGTKSESKSQNRRPNGKSSRNSKFSTFRRRP